MIKNIITRFLFQNKSEELNLLFKIYYLIIFLFTFTILTSLIFSHSIYLKHNVSDRQDFINMPVEEKYKKKINQNDFSINKILTSEILIERLDHQLFDIEYIKKSKKVPDVIIAKFPDDFKNIYSSKLRKNLFIKVALPIIVKENEKLVSQNIEIEKLKNKFNFLKRSEALWLRKKMEEYEVNDQSIGELLMRIDAIPVSIALSQAAVESGWGTSRFASEGNALFGQYVWGTNNHGIIPNDRETDANYKIKSFDSLSESVASYMKNLNTNFHYNEFRINRFVLRSNNIPLRGSYLTEYLFNYSIEDNYTDKIKNIIEINNFEDFDNLNIEKKFKIITDII